MAGTGFDWLLIDGEHAPSDVRKILAQLQAIAAYDVCPVVRLVQGEVVLLRKILDVVAQTVLIPMDEDAEQAAKIVATIRCLPHGIRGVAVR